MTDDTGAAKIAELIKGVHSAMFTTTDTVNNEAHLVSRPMAVQEVEFDGDLWFFTDEGSRKLAHIRTDPRVNITFASASSWVSVAGSAEIVKDDALAKDMWNAALDAWFPDGPETPTLRMIKVHADAAEYWDSPGGRVATLLSFAKAKATGKRYDGGENEVVQLG